jgi:uncharacterized protein
MITQQGALNTTALTVPDLYVQIVPPAALALNGVPSNMVGVVGTAAWGPVGTPTIIADQSSYTAAFGPIQNRKYDMGTHVAIMSQFGPGNFRCVRVTDGTDTAASTAILSTCLTVTAKYTGSLGNFAQVTMQQGSSGPGFYKAVVTLGNGLSTFPAQTPEVFDNLTGAGNALWLAVAAAINGGNSPLRPASRVVTAAAGVGTATPLQQAGGIISIQAAGTGYAVNDTVTMTGGTSSTAAVATITKVGGSGQVQGATITTGGSYTVAPANPVAQGTTSGIGTGLTLNLAFVALPTTYSLSGGADGATVATLAATPSLVYGVDVAPRTGMFALRGLGCAIGIVADMDNSTVWGTIDAYGLSEGTYMMQTGPAGDNIQNAVTVKANVGLNSYSSKLMFGDWLWWQDAVNGVNRLVSPQAFAGGVLANLTPNNSSGNKPIATVIGSQKAGNPGTTQVQTYAEADLSALAVAGIDVISNPCPGGNYWGVRIGHNSSTNAAIYGDNYTRMTYYIASTVNAGMGRYVQLPITLGLFTNITATLNNFFQALLTQGLLTPNLADGSLPYKVLCGPSNNPQSRTGIGYVQADCQITYEGINDKFIVNLQGGSTVVTTQSGSIQ